GHVTPKGLDLTEELPDEVRTVLLRTLAEICGLARGWSHGRGGSMHLRWKEAGAMGTNAIVGGGVPQAAGFAGANRQAGREAVAHMRAGGGPTIVEADTYRYFHQNGPFPGSAFGYRSKEEEQAWRARDTIAQVAGHLVRRSILTQDEVDASVVRAKAVMAE